MASNFDGLDDSAFALPTDKLIPPISICKLEVADAADQETPEDANALVNSHLQRRSSPGPREEPPANTDEDSLMDQMIMALGPELNLKMFQEIECYIFFGLESEPVPEDSDVDETDEEL